MNSSLTTNPLEKISILKALAKELKDRSTEIEEEVKVRLESGEKISSDFLYGGIDISTRTTPKYKDIIKSLLSSEDCITEAGRGIINNQIDSTKPKKTKGVKIVSQNGEWEGSVKNVAEEWMREVEERCSSAALFIRMRPVLQTPRMLTRYAFRRHSDPERSRVSK